MIEYFVIGTLTDPAQHEYDTEGNVVGTITPEVEHAGWHINILAEGLAENPDLDSFIVTPNKLRFEFAGRAEDTVALVFVDRAAAEAEGFVAEPGTMAVVGQAPEGEI